MATDQLTNLPPLLVVREALGLSVDDAAAILEQPAGVVVDMDTQPIETLGRLASFVAPDGAEIIVKILDSDGSTFKEWKVNEAGFFEEFERGN